MAERTFTRSWRARAICSTGARRRRRSSRDTDAIARALGPSMKKALLGAAALVALMVTAPSFAADVPGRMPVKAPPLAPVPVFTWTGFYLGGHVGYLWGHTRIEETETAGALGPTNGVVGGLLGGANWQTGPLVLGGEADIGWSNARGNGAVPLTTEFFEYQIRWTSHVRGRIGYD